MTTDSRERARHWNRIHREVPAERTSWYQCRPGPSLELIEGAGLSPEARILDVGGGTSRLVDCLLEAGYRRLGVLDVSGEALERVRRRLGDRAAKVEWIEADVTQFESPHPWDLWHDRAVLHFLTRREDREAYRARLREALEPGGYAVVATFGPDGPTRCSGLDCRRYGPEDLAGFLGEAFEMEEHVLDDHRTPSGGVQKFLYARLRQRA